MDSQNYRYLYRVPVGGEWYPEGHYGSLSAVSMKDASRHLRRMWPKVEIRRISVNEDSARAVDYGSQEYRKQLFDLAKKH